jgi:hypothetical protein
MVTASYPGMLKFFVFCMVIMGWTHCSFAQTLTKGLIVDSLTMESIPGVHIIIRNPFRSAVSDAQGMFTISTHRGDTLRFSFLGYARTVAVIAGDEDILFVKMRDQSTLLNEIIIRDTPLFSDSKYIQSPTFSSMKPLQASSVPGSVNFAYFTKEEREKRKLVAKIRDLERVRAYIEIVTDPDIRYRIMTDNSLSEARYYELLAVFNQTRQDVMYSGNPAVILSSLFTYFEKSADAKK